RSLPSWSVAAQQNGPPSWSINPKRRTKIITGTNISLPPQTTQLCTWPERGGHSDGGVSHNSAYLIFASGLSIGSYNITNKDGIRIPQSSNLSPRVDISSLYPPFPKFARLGETLEEAREMARDAIRCFRDSALQTVEPIRAVF